MTYSRKQLTEALEAAIVAADLEVSYKFIETPRDLGELDPEFDAYVQVVRRKVRPAPENPRGQFRETFDIYLISPLFVDDEAAEDALDDRLAELTPILNALGWLTWSEAERLTYERANRPAWKFTTEVTTEPEE